MRAVCRAAPCNAHNWPARGLRAQPCMMIVITGVAGAGKTSVARELARQLQWTLLDADDDHSAANVALMRAGIPLTDAERTPWLQAVRARAQRHIAAGEDVVLACSALRQSYREYLTQVDTPVVLVQLRVPQRLVEQRLTNRRGHFMPAALADSQFDALEPVRDGIVVDAAAPVEEVVREIRVQLGV